jgi:hypothetical protein
LGAAGSYGVSLKPSESRRSQAGLGGAERGQQDNIELTFSAFYYYRWAPDLAGATVALAFRGMVDVTT